MNQESNELKKSSFRGLVLTGILVVGVFAIIIAFFGINYGYQITTVVIVNSTSDSLEATWWYSSPEIPIWTIHLEPYEYVRFPSPPSKIPIEKPYPSEFGFTIKRDDGGDEQITRFDDPNAPWMQGIFPWDRKTPYTFVITDATVAYVHRKELTEKKPEIIRTEI